MTENQRRASARAVRRAEIEQLLKDYPNVDVQTKSVLIQWFRHEATALDVALLSCVDELKSAYKAFRDDHVDRVTLKEILLLSGVILAAIGGLFWIYG